MHQQTILEYISDDLMCIGGMKGFEKKGYCQLVDVTMVCPANLAAVTPVEIVMAAAQSKNSV
jgi:hypothetical protein